MTTRATPKTRSLRPFARGCAMACAAMLTSAAGALAQAPAPAPAPSAAEAAQPVLKRAQIDALLATPDKVLILDVRRADEISTIGGFPAYLNIQVADLEKSLAFVPKDRTILTVSNHAARAKRAAALLASHGFRVAGAAGAQDYAAEGGRLTGQKPPAATSAAPAAAPPSAAAPGA